ncbi:MAG: hypothetical protein ABH863_05905 [Candidatus Micrarchaeota archaeon]
MNPYEEVRAALALAFFDKKYVFIALVAGIAMTAIYAYIPIAVTPGNTLELFLDITPVWGLFAIAFLGGLMGVLIAMQYYVIKNTKSSDRKELGSGISAFVSSIISGVFATATCGACVGVLFSFLGTAGVFFLLEHRWEITVFGFLMVAISIFLTSRRINNHCEVCGMTLLHPGRKGGGNGV